ncbi:MAG: hypothetical protein GVY13_13390 [Alphaproteobacteria bacterium]|jgi:hypothetical protein|nr:hypothetical protein [Alphaproteobacteria bacterium]
MAPPDADPWFLIRDAAVGIEYEPDRADEFLVELYLKLPAVGPRDDLQLYIVRRLVTELLKSRGRVDPDGRPIPWDEPAEPGRSEPAAPRYDSQGNIINLKATYVGMDDDSLPY